jgi:Arc/MetJ family transcription regulator
MKITVEVDTNLIDTAMRASARATREAAVQYALQRLIGVDPEEEALTIRRGTGWTDHLTLEDFRSRFPRAG